MLQTEDLEETSSIGTGKGKRRKIVLKSRPSPDAERARTESSSLSPPPDTDSDSNATVLHVSEDEVMKDPDHISEDEAMRDKPKISDYRPASRRSARDKPSFTPTRLTLQSRVSRPPWRSYPKGFVPA